MRTLAARALFLILMVFVFSGCSGGADSSASAPSLQSSSPLSLTPAAHPTYSGCMDTQVAPSYEEQRLANELPGTGSPFADQILAASGFEQFGPDFANQLCEDGAITSYGQALRLVQAAGERLWNAAVRRVQGKEVWGSLPQSDDRMLYWARLKMTLALRQWAPQISLTPQQRARLEWTLESASRGQYLIQFPKGTGFKRIIISGFDPFTLGIPGKAYPSTNIRIGNPSGAIALALNNKQIALRDGTTAVIQTYLLPVRYDLFRQGMQEDTLAPFFSGDQRVDASITISQGVEGQFWIENWNARYHAAAAYDNLGETVGDPFAPPLLPSMPDADIYPPPHWLGYHAQPWQRDWPSQYTHATLPVAAMIMADSGRTITIPGAGAPGGYRVVWHTSHSGFMDCDNADSILYYNDDSVTLPFPPTSPPMPPVAGTCAYSGGGGNYLSNESAYRNTLLRDTLNPQQTIFAGHLHVPVMTHFSNGHDNQISDSLFESYRDTIVQQASYLIMAVGEAIH